jgi:hypothetical protein
MHLSEWAAQHFKMAGESSHQRGGWEAWPFQVGIMNLMSDDDIVEVDVMKSKRVGYTKILTASIAFDAAHRRLNQALWQPTDDDRDSYVKSELDPILEAVPAVRDARSRSKQTEDTMKFKRFIGCVMHLLGGKAARAYRRITVARAKLDEIDGFVQRIEKSSDPFTLAYGRLEGAVEAIRAALAAHHRAAAMRGDLDVLTVLTLATVFLVLKLHAETLNRGVDPFDAGELLPHIDAVVVGNLNVAAGQLHVGIGGGRRPCCGLLAVGRGLRRLRGWG